MALSNIRTIASLTRRGHPVRYRFQSTVAFSSRGQVPSQDPNASVKEFKVILDNDTLYIDQTLAEALGWRHNQTVDTCGETSVSLTLHGWAPRYFAIAPSGSDSERLARATVESSRDSKVRETLEYLKDR